MTTVRRCSLLIRRCNRSRGVTLSSRSYNPEELESKQRVEQTFHYFVGFLESGIVPGDSEFILSGPEENYYHMYLERCKFKMDKNGEIWSIVF